MVLEQLKLENTTIIFDDSCIAKDTDIQKKYIETITINLIRKISIPSRL